VAKLIRKDREGAVRTPSQHQRFTEAARELECDDDKERFEGRLKKIAKAKPKEGKK
jgi:hypothetical protein